MSGIGDLPHGAGGVHWDDVVAVIRALGFSEADGDLSTLRERVAEVESGVAALSDDTPADVGTDTAAAGDSDDVSRANHGHQLDEATATLLPSTDEKAALDGANGASDSNVYATIADLPTGVTFVGCRATMNANQTMTNTTAAVVWDGTETYDTDGIHDAINPSRFSVPTGMGGKWRFTVHINGIGVSGSQDGQVDLYKGGQWVQAVDQRPYHSGTVHGFIATDVLALAADEYLEFYFGTGGTSVWRANTAGSYVVMEKVG